MRNKNINEKNLMKLIKKTLLEQAEKNPESKKGKKDEVKPRCIPENVIPLTEIVGQAGEYVKYSPGISKRGSGVNSMVDTLGILNNIRLFKDVRDGGSHLAYDMMNHSIIEERLYKN